MNVQGKVWGYTSELFNKNNVEIHEILIHKGGFCSKHKHKHKYNKFIVREGRLRVTVWKNYNNRILEDVTILTDGMEHIVAPGDFHMFEALEKTVGMEIYYVSLDENDIERENCGGKRL